MADTRRLTYEQIAALLQGIQASQRGVAGAVVAVAPACIASKWRILGRGRGAG